MPSSTEFRKLNEAERLLISTAAKKGRIPASDPRVTDIDNLVVSYEKLPGGFTVCVLVTYLEPTTSASYDCPIIYRGASRRSYKDIAKTIKGEMIALSRAVLYSRPRRID